MLPRLTATILLALGAACVPVNTEPEVVPEPDIAPTPVAVRPDSTSGPGGIGGRWYGYEGGLEDAEASARSIEGASQYWTESEGVWGGNDSTLAGSYTAYSDRNWIRRLAVTVDSGPRKATGAFTYDERGRLYYFAGEWREPIPRSRSTRRVTASVALNRVGSVGAARKTVNGRAQPMTQDEVEWIRRVELEARGAAGQVRHRR